MTPKEKQIFLDKMSDVAPPITKEAVAPKNDWALALAIVVVVSFFASNLAMRFYLGL